MLDASKGRHMRSLPTGTITFLYTDIQGSTRLWQEAPSLMPGALERHDALLRQAIEDQGGVVFRTMGDAFCAAFVRAADAVVAAAAAQRALLAEPWPGGCEITVRMAIHTGNAEVREGDYVGHALNRPASVTTWHGPPTAEETMHGRGSTSPWRSLSFSRCKTSAAWRSA
jgi:class 3 adenylate cyclase